MTEPINTPISRLRASSGWPIVGLALILIVTAFSFSRILQGEYINWDDHVYVEKVPHEELNPEMVFTFFTTGFNRTYVPLTMLSWAIEIKLLGRSPATHLLINLLLHLCSVCILYLIGKQLNLGKLGSLITAAVFALHPVHVESIAWITERKDVLYGFFFMCSILFYIKDRTSKAKENRFYHLSVLFFLFALLSKGQAVALSLILPAIDYFLGKFSFKAKYALRLLPFFLFSLTFGLIAMKVQEFFEPGRISIYPFHLHERVAIAGVAFFQYMKVSLFPLLLNPINSLPSPLDPLPWTYFLGIASYPIYALLLWLSWKRNRTIFLGLLIYLSCLILMLDHTQIGIVLFADRFLYISVAGYGIALAGLVDSLLKKYNSKVILTGVVVMLSAFSAKTYQQTGYWQNSFSLFGYAMELNPSNPVATGGYGMSLYTKGKFEEAIPYLERSLELLPTQDRVALVAAKSYDILNKPHQAIKYFRKVLVGSSKLFKEKEYVRLIENYLAIGDFSEALRTANQLIFLFPESPQGYMIRGRIMAKHFNQLDRGAEDLVTALELDPGNFVAVNGLGIIEYLKGNVESAEKLFLRSLELMPDNCDAIKNLLTIYQQLEAHDRFGPYEERFNQLGCP